MQIEGECLEELWQKGMIVLQDKNDIRDMSFYILRLILKLSEETLNWNSIRIFILDSERHFPQMNVKCNCWNGSLTELGSLS